MKADHAVRGPGLLAPVALLLPLILPLLLLSAPAAHGSGSTLCLPQPQETACINGTLRTEVDVVADVDITVTGPGADGDFEETVTTDDSGKWNVEVTEPGEYTLSVDEDTLPDDAGLTSEPPTVNIQLGQAKAGLIPARTGDYAAERSRAKYFAQSAVNGVRLGLLLALASVGLSLIYGTMGLSNFAHAEQVTLGGILGWYLVNNLGLGIWIGGTITVAFCAFTGWFQDRVLWQPLRRRNMALTRMLIVSIGLSLTLQYTFQYFAGARTVRVLQDQPELTSFGFITLTDQSIVAMIVSVVVLVAVGFALLRTRLGRATRAVSDNPALAAASGIDVDRVIRIVWTVAMGLAGLSGILYALVVNGIKWDSGLQILLLLFAAVTLGGLGTAFGALVGAMIIGLVVELSPVVGIPGDFKYAAALSILIVALIFRPQGILGKAQRVG